MLGAEKDCRWPGRCPDLGRGGTWRLPEGVCGDAPAHSKRWTQIAVLETDCKSRRPC